MSARAVRLSGLAAMLGSLLGIALTPVLTYLWATNSDVYGYFGRIYFLVFLGLLWGVAGLYGLRRENPGWRAPDNLEREFVGMTAVGLGIGLVGDILEYWGGSPGEGFTRVQVTGYMIEMFGLLFALLGSLLLGLNYRRSRVVPALVAWLLIAAGPGGILLSVMHIPSGSMLLYCCAWVILGYVLWAGRGVKTTT